MDSIIESTTTTNTNSMDFDKLTTKKDEAPKSRFQDSTFFDIYDVTTAEVYGDYIWVSAHDQSCAMRIPLCDNLCKYNPDCEATEEAFYANQDGNIRRLAVDRHDLREVDKKFLNQVRRKFAKQCEQASVIAQASLVGYTRKDESLVYETTLGAEERKSRAKKGLGGFNKNWNGAVVDKPYVPQKETRRRDVVKELKKQTEIVEARVTLQKARRKLAEEKVAGRTKEVLADDADMLKLYCSRDFCYDSNVVADSMEEALTEAAWREYRGKGVIPEYVEYHFTPAVKFHLEHDHRDHAYRSAALMSDDLHFASVSTRMLGRADEEPSRHWWFISYIIFLYNCIINFVRVCKFKYRRWWHKDTVREAYDKVYADEYKKRFRTFRAEGFTILIDLYDELLSRKIIGMRTAPDVVLERMLTRMKNISTLNLPAELNHTHIYQDTLRLAFVKYCQMEKVDYRNFGDAEWFLESKETLMCSMDILKEILDYPLSAQSKVVLESREEFIPQRNVIHPVQLSWVAWFLGLFRLARADTMSQPQNLGYANVWGLILVHTMLHFYLALGGSSTNTVNELYDRLRLRSSPRYHNGLTTLITLISVSWIFCKLPPSLALIPTVILMVVSMYTDSKRSIVSSRPSSILTSNMHVSSTVGVIMRSASLVLLLVPLSIMFFIQTDILSSMCLSVIESHISKEDARMVLWCLRVIIALLSVILHRTLCKVASSSYTPIFFRISEIILDSISVMRSVSNKLSHVLSVLTRCICWVTLILSMVFACLEKCSHLLETVSQTSCLCCTSFLFTVLMVWMVSAKETMVSISSLLNTETVFQLQLTSLLTDSMSSASYTSVSEMLRSVGLFMIRRLVTFFENHSKLSLVLDGNFKSIHLSQISAWDYFVPRHFLSVMSALDALSYLQLLVKCLNSLLTIYRTLVSTLMIHINLKLLLSYAILLPLTSVVLTLLIDYSLRVGSDYLSMLSWPLNERLRRAKKYRASLLDRDYNFISQITLPGAIQRTGRDMSGYGEMEHL